MQELAGKHIKRPKAGSCDYSELLQPNAPNPLPKAATAINGIPARAPAGIVGPLPALPDAAGPHYPISAADTARDVVFGAAPAPSAPLSETGPADFNGAVIEPELNPPASEASSLSPAKPKRRRFRKADEAVGLNGPEELSPAAVPSMASNPAVNLCSAVAAVGNVIGHQPLSPGVSSNPPALEPLLANSASSREAKRGTGVGSMTRGEPVEHHMAARGKENSPPGRKKGPAENASGVEKRSMWTQTSPSETTDARQKHRANRVQLTGLQNEDPEEPLVVEMGGWREGFHTVGPSAGEPRVLSYEGGFIGGVISGQGGAYSTAGDGRMPSLPGSVAPPGVARASLSAGRSLTSADAGCLSTGRFGGTFAVASGGVDGEVSRGVSEIVNAAEQTIDAHHREFAEAVEGES